MLMSRLTTNEPLTTDEAEIGLANRFTVVLLRPDFTVEINGKFIHSTTALPEFELRIPDDKAFAEEVVDGKSVKYWAGFVRKADWASDQGGVGVFVHGKSRRIGPSFSVLKAKKSINGTSTR